MIYQLCNLYSNPVDSSFHQLIESNSSRWVPSFSLELSWTTYRGWRSAPRCNVQLTRVVWTCYTWPHSTSLATFSDFSIVLRAKLCLLMHSVYKGRSRQYMTDMVHTPRPTPHGLCSTDGDGNLHSRPLMCPKIGEWSFSFAGPDACHPFWIQIIYLQEALENSFIQISLWNAMTQHFMSLIFL
jgi:hypothetical protein